jgi:pimeloyl-ACP methyl ester carboxylesterase
MPTIARPDGATIHYEVAGSGFPLLLIAPGGVSSQIEFWERSAFNPLKELSDEFRVIGMDQRHAGRSLAPPKAWDWADAAADQVAVLDAVGAGSAHVMGGCIGCAHIWNLLQAAPGRISAAVAQNPVGLDETNNLGVFYAMFNETMRVARAEGMVGVVKAAMENPLFVMNNAAGPFAPTIAADEAVRDQIARMPKETYIALVIRFRDGMWPDRPPYFTATPEWMQTCTTPILVAPGNDPFHPRGIGERICREAPNATCLPFLFSDPGRKADYIAAVRTFLKQQTPA